jgi:molybdate transport system permease protein
MGAEELRIVVFTVEMAALATAFILVPGVAAAFLLARYQGPGKGALDTLLSLPLVLPPTVVGFLLLELLGRNRPVGAWLTEHGIEVVFTWKAVVLPPSRRWTPGSSGSRARSARVRWLPSSG